MDKYTELKNYITSVDENGKISEWFLTHGHIIDLEKQLEEQKKQINEYQKFFSLLSSLLHKTPTIHDIIN